jgi:hypothetical protein
MSEFIFMLTKDDQTVADALSVYDEVRGAACAIDAALRWSKED